MLPNLRTFGRKINGNRKKTEEFKPKARAVIINAVLINIINTVIINAFNYKIYTVTYIINR